MSASSLIPKNGAVSYGSLDADFHGFTLRKTQMSENVTPYGTNACTKNVGNGTPDFDYTIAAFALAHASSSPAGMTVAAAGGVAATLTLDTGVTEAAQLIETSFEIQHGRMRSAVPYAIAGKNAGDLTETWATS